MKPVDIRPWAEGRVSYISSILEADNHPDNQGSAPLTLADMETRTDLLSASISPVWETNSGKSAEDIADKVIKLCQDLNQTPTIKASIQLYQILFTDYYTHFGTWASIEKRWNNSELASSDFMFDLFMDWFEFAPEVRVAEAALFFLARTRKKPPLDILMSVAHDYRLSVAVGSLIKNQYDADEDILIRIAKLHHYAVREITLSFLKTVEREENIEWLLTEGYNSKAYYHPCGYYAALHCDLLSLLKAPVIEPDRLVHYAKIIGDMCQAWGGASSWRNIEDYEDGLEAIEFFFTHVNRNKQPVALAGELRDILRYLDSALLEYDGDPSIDCDKFAQLYDTGQAFFVEPYFSYEERLRYLFWEQPKPTISDLQTHGIQKFHDVLYVCTEEDDHVLLEQVVDWVHKFLCMDSDLQTQDARKTELLSQRMPGICSGGIAGLQDPGLSSVYGQLLLQTTQALKGTAHVGIEILLTSLKTDYPHLPKAAAEAFLSWADQSKVPEEAKALIALHQEE